MQREIQAEVMRPEPLTACPRSVAHGSLKGLESKSYEENAPSAQSLVHAVPSVRRLTPVRLPDHILLKLETSVGRSLPPGTFQDCLLGALMVPGPSLPAYNCP